MTRYLCKAQALTPVHVGCGRILDPGAFLLRENDLLHFNPAMVLRDLSPESRRAFMAIADRGNFVELQAFFRKHCDPERHGLGLIPIGVAVRRELEAKLGKPENRFEIQLMPRNALCGRVYLPGSGIKGALRTAVVNHFTNRVPELKDEVHRKVNAEPDDKWKGRVLEEEALARKQSQTERDVFRLVEVRDVDVPPDSTRIDRAYNWNPNKAGSGSIQLWVERLVSRVDTPDAPQFGIELGVDDARMEHARVGANMGRTLDIRTIAAACNHFYWHRFLAERDRFFPSEQGRPSERTRRLYQAMAPIFRKSADGKTIVQPPIWPFILLRVGRFSQFESLSVDELRQGHRPQARTPEARRITDMAATRNLCDIGANQPALPFGWMLLKVFE